MAKRTKARTSIFLIYNVETKDSPMLHWK